MFFVVFFVFTVFLSFGDLPRHQKGVHRSRFSPIGGVLVGIWGPPWEFLTASWATKRPSALLEIYLTPLGHPGGVQGGSQGPSEDGFQTFLDHICCSKGAYLEVITAFSSSVLLLLSSFEIRIVELLSVIMFFNRLF